MAYIDDDGLIWPEPDKGDVLSMAHCMRDDYGPLSLPSPVLIVHHATARWMPDGQTKFPLGMWEIGARVKKRPYYGSVYIFRNGQAVQVNRYGRSSKATAGSVMVDGKKREINRVAFQIEWDSWATCDSKGNRGGVPSVNPKRKDAVRNPDTKVYPGVYWQNVTDTQAKAVAEVCAAVVAKSKMNPVDALHGHLELGRGTHWDPGPEIIRAMESIVAPRLGLAVPFVAPARDIRGPTPVTISSIRVA